MEYLVVIGPTDSGYRAEAPDLDGCVATAASRTRVEEQIRRVLEFQLCDLRHRGLDPPEPRARAVYIEVTEVAMGPVRL